MKFRSPEHALTWAYETINRPIVKLSSVNDMREKGKSGTNDEMTPHDRHAQAAMILAMCERVLPTLHMAYVQVQFGRDGTGFSIMSYYLAGTFGTGLHSRRAIELMIRSYCGDRVGLREIKKTMSCGMLKAVSIRNRAYDALDAIHAQTMDRLAAEMECAGLREVPA